MGGKPLALEEGQLLLLVWKVVEGFLGLVVPFACSGMNLISSALPVLSLLVLVVAFEAFALPLVVRPMRVFCLSSDSDTCYFDQMHWLFQTPFLLTFITQWVLKKYQDPHQNMPKYKKVSEVSSSSRVLNLLHEVIK